MLKKYLISFGPHTYKLIETARQANTQIDRQTLLKKINSVENIPYFVSPSKQKFTQDTFFLYIYIYYATTANLDRNY